MSERESKSESSAGVVIVVVLLLLFLPCAAGVLLFGGFVFARLQVPQAMPLPPVPGANAPLAGPAPGGMTSNPARGAATINGLKSRHSLFEEADKVLTLAKYDQIQAGMSYEDVISSLEIPEDKQPSEMNLVGPQSEVELTWFGGPGDAKSITVKMKGKVVVDKSQTGLE